MKLDEEKFELRLKQSLDKQAITEVLYRYAEGIDTRNWKVLRSCFIDDVAADYGDVGKWYSADAITEAMEDLHRDMGHTLHRVGNVLIEFHGDAARSRSYVHALLNETPEGAKLIQAYGIYRDHFVKKQGVWKISERKFTLIAMR